MQEIVIILLGVICLTQIPRIMPKLDFGGVLFCVIGIIFLLALLGVV